MFTKTLLTCLLPALLAVGLRGASIVAGPMLGVPEMRQVRVWLQTDTAADTQIRFKQTVGSAPPQATATVQTRPENAHTAILTLGPLSPGTRYQGQVFIDGTASGLPFNFSTPEAFRGTRPPPDFQIAVAGSHYVNEKAYDPAFRTPGGDYAVFETIAGENPAWMLWLGSSLQLREADWGSFYGITARYTHNRALPEAQTAYRSLGHAGLIGETDFGPPLSDRHFWNQPESLRTFRLFWPNPTDGVAGLNNLATVIRWSDAEFFLLDDRTHRDLTSELESQRQVLGKAQIEWLITALRASPARFKVICMGSPILNPAESPRHLTAAPNERARLLDAISQYKISGVLFLTGGKRYGELTKVVRRNAPDIYELTLGTLTGNTDDIERDLNFFRVPGTTMEQRHYALLRFEGAEDARSIVIMVKDSQGEELWQRTLPFPDMAFRP
ncbi:MAG: alkaline phosphatase D family protein [Opitutales bacterium]